MLGEMSSAGTSPHAAPRRVFMASAWLRSSTPNLTVELQLRQYPAPYTGWVSGGLQSSAPAG